MTDCTDLIDDMYFKTLGYKEILAEKEAKLADAKKIEAQGKKISKLILEKIDFTRVKAFKR